MRVIVKYFASVVLLLVCGEASAQKMKERSCVRNGNDYFNKKEFRKSIECYEEALQHDPNSFEAKFDLGSALYSCERYEEAEKTLQPLLENKSLSDVVRGEVAYNLGNTQFAQKKYKEALSSYRTAMRCNPNDEDAKFNYAYTKLKLQQQEQQQQENQNQDQNQGQNQNQNQDQNKDQQNQKNDKQDQQNDQNKDQNKNNNQDKDQNKDQQNDQNKDKDNQQNKDDKEDKNNQNKDDKQDNKQDDKQDNKQNNNKDKEQPNDNNQGGQQPQNQNGKNDPQQGDNPQPSGVTPEQEAMLQAIQAEEDKTQDKLDKEKAGVLIFRGKNW